MNETEVKQCRILTMVMKNLDMANLKDRALRVLDENPDNPLALMVYNAEFSAFYEQNTALCVQFNEQIVTAFLKEHGDTLDFDTFLAISRLILMKEASASDSDDSALIGSVLKHADAKCKDGGALTSFYNMAVFLLCNTETLNYFTNRQYYSEHIADALKARKTMIKIVHERLKNTDKIAPEKKAELINKITSSVIYEKPVDPNAPEPQPEQPQKSHVGLFVGVGIGIFLLIIFFTLL